MTVKGVALDANTRCRHYGTDKDIIAIKFKCCETFYACYGAMSSLRITVRKYGINQSGICLPCFAVLAAMY